MGRAYKQAMHYSIDCYVAKTLPVKHQITAQAIDAWQGGLVIVSQYYSTEVHFQSFNLIGWVKFNLLVLLGAIVYST